MRLLLLLLLAALTSGCLKSIPLAAPQSPQPLPREGDGLRAGFARVDITPPPGPAMIGYGPEGKVARGYRGRLYARAMVLEDQWGERIAIVGLDLGMSSVILHRQVSLRTAADVVARIGADRLVLAGTHTHGGPGNFFAVPGLDMFGSSALGYDERFTGFLVERVAEAVRQAASDLRRARAGWGVDSVWGHTRIRSFPAFLSNDPLWRYPVPPPPGNTLSEREKAVDPAWRLLRVDTWDEETRSFRPRGAFSVFSIHGTAIPSANDLFDPDVHGIVSRALEVHIDSLAGRARGLRRHAVHVFGNGAEGDVSPDVPAETRCQVPELGVRRRHAGPRTTPAPVEWIAPPDTALEGCMRRAKFWTDSLARGLAAAAAAQFDEIGWRMDRLEAVGRVDLTRGLRIERAFATVPLRRTDEERLLCQPPQVGASLPGGAEDGRSRLWDSTAVVVRDTAGGRGGCHAQKRPAFGWLQGVLVGRHGLPEVAQLTVFRIGGMLIGTLPGEPTTTVGARIRAAMASHAGVAPDSVILMGVTNGYVQYVTTREEYGHQFYEGAATEYGPGSALFFEDALSRLAATLRPGSGGRPPAAVTPLTAYWRFSRKSLPRPAGPQAGEIDRRFNEARWAGDTLVVRWNDLAPGRLVPADAPMVLVERQDGAGWAPVTWDDDHELEVRARGRRGRDGFEWEARWRPCRRPAGATYRVVLLGRADMKEEVRSDSLVSGPAPRCIDDLR